MKQMNSEISKHSVILFDGTCILCSWTVRFIIRRDSRRLFRFAAMQSEVGEKMLPESGVRGKSGETVVLSENGKYYVRSTAILRIFRKLPGLWTLLYFLILIPRPLRDFFYKFVAGKRYSWFGRYDDCMIPEESIRSRFIDQPVPGSDK